MTLQATRTTTTIMHLLRSTTSTVQIWLWILEHLATTRTQWKVRIALNGRMPCTTKFATSIIATFGRSFPVANLNGRKPLRTRWVFTRKSNRTRLFATRGGLLSRDMYRSLESTLPTRFTRHNQYFNSHCVCNHLIQSHLDLCGDQCRSSLLAWKRAWRRDLH